MLWEELLVAAFEDVHLRIVEAGVVVGGPVSFPNETAPGTNRGVGVRAGRAVGWTSGDLFPAPTPLRTLGNHRRLKCKHVSHKNPFRSVWLLGTEGESWGDGMREANRRGSLFLEGSSESLLIISGLDWKKGSRTERSRQNLRDIFKRSGQDLVRTRGRERKGQANTGRVSVRRQG